MGTTLGIYEPFKPYVKKQLEVRKNLMENSDSLRNEEFYAYTVEKRCVITMASGVDLLESAKDDFLEEDEKEKKIGSGLARQYILQGGTQHYNREGGFSGLREGFTTLSEKDDRERSFSYGDKNIRSNPDDDFGIVPMPGIVDATIATKSAEGALREATVNFICHNRRQLSVLETLYMRIGFPLLLEWQWSPYIDNDSNKQTAEATILDEFFNPDSDFDKLNAKIKRLKEASGGNYDGFVGYCKNFSFKVREDGGYDCQTEIMAQGDILEGLKLGKEVVESPQYTKSGLIFKLEVVDKLLKYLRSIKKTAYFEEFDPLVSTPLIYNSNGTYVKANTNRKYKKLKEAEIERYDKLKENGEISESAYDEAIRIVKNNYENRVGNVTTRAAAVISPYKPETLSLYNVGTSDSPFYILYKDLTNFKGYQLYSQGYSEVQALFEDIIKAKLTDIPDQNEELIDDQSGVGYRTFLGGTILKQVLKYENPDPKSDPDYGGSNIYSRKGYDNNVYIRWDLLCQIINQLCTDQYKEGKPVVELSYINDGVSTYTPGNKRKVISRFGDIVDDVTTDGSVPLEEALEKHFYLQYSAPNDIETSDPISSLTSAKTYTGQQGSDTPNISTPQLEGLSPATSPSGVDTDKYHPLLGHSYDYEVCLLPHMPFFDNINRFDPNVLNKDDNERVTEEKAFVPLTSFNNIFYSEQKKNSIGLIYFNLDYVIKEYVSMRFSSVKDETLDDHTVPRFNPNFGILEFTQRLWEGVNNACAGYYNFDVTTDHEKPHVAKVIEKTINGTSNKDDLFEFDPQGLSSITRDFVFDSSITKDFASAVSIAAQAPTEENSLDIMTFKAFNKNVKNRFTSDATSLLKKEIADVEARNSLQRDVNRYIDLCYAIEQYVTRLSNANISPYRDANGTLRNVLTPSEAKISVQELEELRIRILQRFPLKDKEGNDHPKAGYYRKRTSLSRNMVIPLNFSIKMDGIGGILPRQVFNINPQRLPEAYANAQISFIVFPESQTITSTGDWTVEFTGQMVNDYVKEETNTLEGVGINNDGTNPYNGELLTRPDLDSTLDNLDKAEEGFSRPQNQADSSIWANPVDHPIVINSPWGRERPDGDPNRRHTGVDIRAGVQGIAGDPVLSAATGVVISTRESLSGCGNEVTIKHVISDGEFKTRYCHLETIFVSEGDEVEKTDTIGTMGDSGDAEGVHLHYEMYHTPTFGSAMVYSLPSWWETLSNGKKANNTNTLDPCIFLYDEQQEENLLQ